MSYVKTRLKKIHSSSSVLIGPSSWTTAVSYTATNNYDAIKFTMMFQTSNGGGMLNNALEMGFRITHNGTQVAYTHGSLWTLTDESAYNVCMLTYVATNVTSGDVFNFQGSSTIRNVNYLYCEGMMELFYEEQLG